MTDRPTDPQQLAIDFLSHPANYGLRDEAVEQIETHCSIVFLAGDRAYKLKRAIRYASLDYTTDALRKAACEAELRLNRRTAPELYLRVSSINRSATGFLAFDGSGPAIDYVVVMRRFARSDLFDYLMENGNLTTDLMQALGESIARFHSDAEPVPAFGGAAAIGRVIADNNRELALVGSILDRAAVDHLSDRAETELVEVAGLLDRRREEGRVRRCHGDLRLANICLYDGRPTLFDCIEFSNEIGCIDVLYDLAFLLMDLDMRGRFDLCNAVFNAYLDHARETDGLRVLPLFLSLRAATRGYALAGKAHRTRDPSQAEHLKTLARRHVDAALSFLKSPLPVLILLGGEDGQRRLETTARLAALVSPAPGARILHLTSSGAATSHEVLAVLRAGCSVVLEGVFRNSDEQNATFALPPVVRIIRCWVGPFPSGLNQRMWRSLDSGLDAETVVAAVPGSRRVWD